jgi:DNA-binding response OmpR family regulator
MRILVIEDETRLADIIARVLRQERFDVDVAYDGVSGLELALGGTFDVIILDRMLPGRDGMDVLRELRSERIATPVLILTARSDLSERVEGLDAGADDYLGKPFAFDELLARIRVLLRRVDRPLVDDLIVAGEVRINLTSHTVERDGHEVRLTPREFALLETLARNRGRTMSRDELVSRVWGYDADPLGNAVDIYIHYLRRKLDSNGTAEADRMIRTVRGVGYVFEAGGR